MNRKTMTTALAPLLLISVAPPTPDGELTVDDLLGLIRAPATGRSTASSCTPADVRLSVTEPDAAAGHRYAQLTATNISGRTCELVGWPGLGLRGEWGTALHIVAEHSITQVDRVGVPPADSDTAVALAVGGRVVAEFKWTGALAGTREEHVSLIAVQLTANAAPAAFLVDRTDNVDIGPDTTVRVGPWGAGELIRSVLSELRNGLQRVGPTRRGRAQRGVVVDQVGGVGAGVLPAQHQ